MADGFEFPDFFEYPPYFTCVARAGSFRAPRGGHFRSRDRVALAFPPPDERSIRSPAPAPPSTG